MNEKKAIKWNGYDIMQNEIFMESYCKNKNYEFSKIDTTIAYQHKLPVFGYTFMKIHSPDLENILSIIQKTRTISAQKNAAFLEIITPYKDDTIERYIIKSDGTYIINYNNIKNHEGIWKIFHRNVRQKINQAKQSGVFIEEAKNENDFNAWWKLYEVTVRTKEFKAQKYNLVHDLFNNSDISRLFLAKYEDKIISGAFLLLNKGILRWLSAMDLDFARNRPNNLLEWEIMKWGKDQGYAYYDMGGAIINENHGPTEFKKSFGGEYRELYTYRIPIVYLKNIIMGMALKFYK
ncbi:MAG: GNAT family N-acetyltransferase [Candidatus Methanoperedens sp.]